MTIVVNPRPYKGRFLAKALDLIKQGVRVGHVHIGPEDGKWTCHGCEHEHDKPLFNEGHNDDWVVCQCGMPFICEKI